MVNVKEKLKQKINYSSQLLEDFFRSKQKELLNIYIYS